jgi:hypothetical protein
MGYEQRRTVPTKPLPHGWFLTGWRGGYRDIVGMPMRHDFFIVDPQRCPGGLILEATFQSSTGSTDKKVVFTVLSLKPLPHRIVLFLDGKGFKPAYVDWCLAQQEPGHLDVYTDWDTFRATLNEGIL